MEKEVRENFTNLSLKHISRKTKDAFNDFLKNELKMPSENTIVKNYIDTTYDKLSSGQRPQSPGLTAMLKYLDVTKNKTELNNVDFFKSVFQYSLCGPMDMIKGRNNSYNPINKLIIMEPHHIS